MYLDHMAIALILLLGVIGNNSTVSIAAAVLLLIKLIGGPNWLPYIESHGMFIGIVCLTMAVLAPLAEGKTTTSMIFDSFKTSSGWIAIIIGILVSWLAAQGVQFLKDVPSSVSSLLIGTILGICFFRGLAAGPLIAAGIVSIIMAVLKLR